MARAKSVFESVFKNLKSASACPTKSDVFSSRPNFWNRQQSDFNVNSLSSYLVDLRHGGCLGVHVLPGLGVLLAEVLKVSFSNWKLPSWLQALQHWLCMYELVQNFTCTKTKKFLNLRFSKRPMRSEVRASFSSAGTCNILNAETVLRFENICILLICNIFNTDTVLRWESISISIV